MKTTFQSGKWLAICDVCGLRFHNDQLRKDWKGLMVCNADYESRHPQDLLRVDPEHTAPPWVRPESEDVFITACTYEGRTATPGVAIPGCSIPGTVLVGTLS